MNLRAFALNLILAFELLLVMLNLTAFAAPTVLNLGLAEVSAPRGMVTLAFTELISALFVIYIVIQQAGVMQTLSSYVGEIQDKLCRELAQNSKQ